MPVEYEPTPKGVTARYANGVTLVLDFKSLLANDLRSYRRESTFRGCFANKGL